MKSLQKLPQKIKFCPIIDALIELRFETEIERSAVYGMIYGLICKDYPGSSEALPIVQIPEPFRVSDPSLRFKPYYRLRTKDVIFQIGPDVITISSSLPYIGWERFAEHIMHVLGLVQSGNNPIIKRVVRFGHRYVNFFVGDMKDNITMKFSMTEGYITQSLSINTQIRDSGFDNTVQFIDSAELTIQPTNEKKIGSIIDIDTAKNYHDGYFLEHIAEELNAAHQCEKGLFFSILKEDFLTTLHPEY
ncbi:MAG: TIGR04255 family protein [Bacteroidaceae bacterium]|nr:TIGR04255 family protein [Bacteroidaceae bacterium]